MKTPRAHHSLGAALVVVLSLLVMMVVLVVAFFMAVETETLSSSAYRSQGKLRQLSDLPLQIVQTQLQAATTLGQTGALSQVTSTWTSQPGLLRVYHGGGGFERAYKLYSSAEMDTGDLGFIGQEISSSWNEEPDQWVNLNEPFTSVSDPDQKQWPILNPAAVNWAQGVVIGDDPAGEEQAAMPVEWLYVLDDGQMVPYAELPDGAMPSGRIAFWADDETAKVNVNTAGERTFWDRPRFAQGHRARFARNQPSTGEYNAYPGHPATVSLSAVFERALKNVDGEADSEADVTEAMLALSPRYRWGGSESGTLSIWDERVELDRNKNPEAAKNDRLYATPSEFLLNIAREVQDERLEEPIRESGFLLTESSRAPELNAFGTPRVTIWPIDSDPQKRTVYDRLIARVSTVGDKGFYFERASPAAQDEAEAIQRNWELMEYLDTLTQKEVSGFANGDVAGMSFEDKWGTQERRQILTQLFDYIRSVNLSDTSRPPSEYGRQFTPATSDHRGVVLPTQVTATGWNTRGAGRVPVLERIGLVFYAVRQQSDTEGVPVESEIRCMVWMNFFSPMFGLAPHSMQIRVRMSGFHAALGDVNGESSTPFTLTGTQRDFTFPNPQSTYDWGGAEDMIGSYRGGQLHFTGSGKTIDYEFISSNLVKINGDKMMFYGGTWTLEVYDQRNPSAPLQTYRLTFPSSPSPWPVPLLYGGRNDVEMAERYNSKEGGSTGADSGLGRRRVGEAPSDVIRAIELRDGDVRQIAHLREVPASYYQPAWAYFSPEVMLGGHLRMMRASVLLEGGDDLFGAATLANNFSGLGRHVPLTHFSVGSLGRNFELPSLPHAVDGTQLASLRSVGWTGDFDNGFFREADGAYLNKPDEGHHIPKPNGSIQPYERADTYVTWSDGTKSRWDPAINGFFSPTRQIPSPVMFGSLPSGVVRTRQAYIDEKPENARPWETLLFCPNSLAATAPDGSGRLGHPGASAPRDPLLLDLFTMPVVEPYAISEPFSTAGKVNLNQRIIPFTYIRRETGLYAVLKNMELSVVPDRPRDTDAPVRVNVPATLREMAAVWDPDGKTGLGAFRSASEICDIFLVPSNLGNRTLLQYWGAHQRTGNNSREMPYAMLYPLLTTKSNTYQVHYRVQTLRPKKRRASADGPERFVVEGEQRGSYVIERYLDVNDPRFFGNPPEVDPDKDSLNPYYRFRMLRHARFTPGF